MKATITLKKKIGKYTIISDSVMEFDDAVKFFNHEDFVSSTHHHHDINPNLNSKFNGYEPRKVT